MRALALVLSFAASGFANAEPARDGVLDPSFGTDGIVRANLVAAADVDLEIVNDALEQADGKLLLIGNARRNSAPSVLQPVVLRLNADGSVDFAYGDNGVFVYPAGGVTDTRGGDAYAATFLSDGRLLVVGGVYDPLVPLITFKRCTLVFALTANGLLDANYGPGPGPACTDFGFPADSSFDGSIRTGGVAAANDGKAYISGRIGSAAPGTTVVARLDVDGRFDSSFDGDGKAFFGTDFYGGLAATPGLIVAESGAILVAGDRTGSRYAVAKLLPSGALDPNFGDAGIAGVNISTGFTLVTGFHVDTNERIWLSGIANDMLAPKCNYCVTRFTPAGALDTSFNATGQQAGVPGLALISAGQASSGEYVEQILARPGNGIALVGHSIAVHAVGGSDMDFLVMDLADDGALVARFGDAMTPGQRAVQLAVTGNSTDYGTAGISLRSGRMLLVGATQSATDGWQFGAARLLDDAIFAHAFD